MKKLILGATPDRAPHPLPQALPPADPVTLAAIEALMLRRTRIKSSPPQAAWTQPTSWISKARE